MKLFLVVVIVMMGYFHIIEGYYATKQNYASLATLIPPDPPISKQYVRCPWKEGGPLANEDAVVEQGGCECGIYSTNNPKTDETPMMSRENVPMSCNEQGTRMCEELCVTLARAAANKGPAIVCDVIKDAEDVIVHLFSRVCKMPNWKYSGESSTQKLCCNTGKPAPCVGQSTVPQNLIGEVPVEAAE